MKIPIQQVTLVALTPHVYLVMCLKSDQHHHFSATPYECSIRPDISRTSWCQVDILKSLSCSSGCFCDVAEDIAPLGGPMLSREMCLFCKGADVRQPLHEYQPQFPSRRSDCSEMIIVIPFSCFNVVAWFPSCSEVYLVYHVFV